MTLEKAFGQILREQRKNANFSQETLAFKCGIDRTYVSLLERGMRHPSMKTIFKIAQALQVSPASIVEDVERALTSDK